MAACAVAAEPGQEAPPDAQDVESVLRTGQLRQWLGQPVTLAEGLCIQLRYPMRWPDARKGPGSDREEDALRLSREYCSAALGDGNTGPSRLVVEAKTEFRARLQRMYGVQFTIQACQKHNADAGRVAACVHLAVGRTLSEQERRWLLAAADK